ncbi:MAG: DUF3450 family protein [Planctomycetota bacterium]
MRSPGEPFPRIRIRCRCAALLAAAWLPLASSAGTEAGDERAEVARRIQARVESLQRLLEDRLARQAILRDEAARLEARIRSLEPRRDSLAAENRDLRADLAELTAKLQDARNRRAHRRAVLAGLAPAAASVAGRVAARIRTGIPHRRSERAAQMAEIARLLGGDAAEKRAEALRRLCVAAGRELQLAATRELTTGQVMVAPGVSKHAYLLRLGLVNELCFTEDGGFVGIAARREQPEWRFLPDGEDRRRARTALACVRQQQPPRIALLTFILEAGGE